MDIWAIGIPLDDLFGLQVLRIDLFIDNFIQLSHLFIALVIEVGLLGIENVIIFQQKQVLFFMGFLIFSWKIRTY